VAVIDGHWATVGSSNLDPLSLLLAREANVVVDDQGFAQAPAPAAAAMR
jgi:cardiolipin synthase